MTYDDLLGVPYLEGGRTKAGLDCWGLILELFRRKGVVIPDVFTPRNSDLAQALTAGDPDWLALMGGWRKVGEPAQGRIVGFLRPEGHHAGYLIEDRRVLHAVRGHGVIVTRLDRAPWGQSIVGFYERNHF